jgi:spermidine synthase
MGFALIASALAAVALPFLARPVAECFIPRGLALDEAAAVLTWGSLAASLLLFLPAAFLLGLIGPLAVEELQRQRGGHAGEAGGRILAASTLGSLAGTFATTHLFLPGLGLRLTFLAASTVLAGMGAAALVSARSARAAAGLGLLFAGAAVLASYRGPDLPDGTRLLAQRESAYQQLRVLEREVDGEPWRQLAVNEGLDSFQSVWQPRKGLLPNGYYYNLFAFPPWLSAAQSEWRMLVLGFGAGTAVRVVEGCLPAGVELDSLGVEIDPAVVELGEAWFEVERGPRRRVHGGLDARAALRWTSRPFDQIVLDTYANNVEVPVHLSTLEFFRELRLRLAPGGWLVVNAAGFGLDDPVVRALAGTAAAAFEQPALVVRVPFSRNCTVLLRVGAVLLEPSEWECDQPELARLAQAVALPGAWCWVEPAETPATDDRNPIESLQRSSLRAGRGRWWEDS